MRFFVALIAFLACVPAYAGVQLVPTPPVPGDGTTVSTVRLYVDSGAKVKIKAEAGKVGAVAVGEDGIVTVLWTAPAVTASRTFAFKVTGGGEDVSIDVPVSAPFSGELAVTFDQAMLPSTGTAMIRIRPSGGSPIAMEARRYLVSVSAGTVEASAPSGDGSWVARYTPPKSMTAPVSVIVAAADAAAPDKVYGYAVLPVSVKRSVSIDAKAGSSNVLRVADRTYGPLVAAPTGKVAFDVDLDPRQPIGKLQSVLTDGSREERDAALPIPPTPQVLFLPTPATVPADASLRIPVRVLLASPDGHFLTDQAPRLTAARGAFDAPVGEHGPWLVTYTPPTTVGDVTLTMEAEGIKAERHIKVLPALPSVVLSPDLPEIPKTATSFKVTARVKDATGTGMPGRPPVFTAVGATVSGTTKDNADGSYTSTWKLNSGATSARIFASPPVEATGNVASRVLAWPLSSTIAANGTDTVNVMVVAIDAYGLPVANLDVRLGVPKGDGSLPPTVKTDARGIARVPFRAGKTAGLGAIHVEAAGLVWETPIYQTLGGIGPTLVATADPETEKLLGRWQAAVPETYIVKEGTVPPSGPPATVIVSTVPPYTTPGAAILVTVRVMDAAGKGVAGQKLAVQAIPGALGAITDNRDGSYTFAVQLGAGQDGPVNLSVTAGTAQGVVSLPTLAQLGAQQTAATPTATAGTKQPAQSTGATAAKTPKQAKASVESDIKKFRGVGGFTNVHGSFRQDGDGGDRLLGEASYSSPGTGFFGLGLDAQYYFVEADFGMVGAELRTRVQFESYSVDNEDIKLSIFGNTSGDIIVSGLYRRTLAGPFGVQGALGYHRTGGMLMRYTDADLDQVTKLKFPLNGVRIAAAGIVEVESHMVQLEFAETFAPFPIDTHFGLAYDLGINAMLFRLSGGYDLRTASYETSGGDGEADTSLNQIAVNVMAGVSF